jgi:hypothetical protein
MVGSAIVTDGPLRRPQFFPFIIFSITALYADHHSPPPSLFLFYLVMKKDINVGDVVYLTGGVFIGDFAFVLGLTRKMIELQIIRTNLTTRVMAYNVTKVETDFKLPSTNKDDHGNVDVYKKINDEIIAMRNSVAKIESYL